MFAQHGLQQTTHCNKYKRTQDHKPTNQSTRVQMDLHAKRRRATHSDTLLRLRRQTTNPFGHKVGSTRFQNHSNLVQQNGLLFLQMHISIMADNMELQVRDTPQGQVATIAPITTIAPTTLTPTGADIVRGGTSDLWQYNNNGELVRVHVHTRTNRCVIKPRPPKEYLGKQQTVDYLFTLLSVILKSVAGGACTSTYMHRVGT